MVRTGSWWLAAAMVGVVSAFSNSLRADEPPASEPPVAKPKAPTVIRALRLLPTIAVRQVDDGVAEARPADGDKPASAPAAVPARAVDIAELQRQLQEQQAAGRKAAEDAGSHKFLREVKIEGPDGLRLQTLAVDPTGRILGLVAMPRGYSAPDSGARSEVHVLSSEGEPVAVWKVDFHATAVNAGPDGTVYVAGDGRVARFSPEGQVLGVTELPFIQQLLADSGKLREAARLQIEAQAKAMENTKKVFTERLAKLEEQAAAAKERGDEVPEVIAAQITQYKQIIEANFGEARTNVEAVVQGILGRLRVVNGVAADAEHVYVVCGESEGYGFAVWRMKADFTSPEKVMANVSGCCGQMDIQCCPGGFVLAENTKHRFALYDSTGKELVTGGRRGEAATGGFGGCCNPMNTRVVGGDILTAESEGIIQRYSATGEFRGVVGAVSLTGGCKNVALGATPDLSRVFFCDLPGSRVLILGKKPSPSVVDAD